MSKIHPTAQVASGAQLAGDVEIGPYCIVGDECILHAGVKLVSHVIVSSRTEIGENSIVYPFASLGAPGQIYQNQAEVGRLKIGKRCEIREHVTMNCGSPRAKLLTDIGDDCMFMVGAHIAHDCTVGRKSIFANNATLGGHVDVGEQVFIGGLSAIHQFCTIGEHAIVGGVFAVRGHVIPYGNVSNNLNGLNLVGLSRRGFSDHDLKIMQRAYREIFLGPGVLFDRVAAAKIKYADNNHVQRIISFMETVNKKRPLTLPAQRK
ncbi:MAG: acyl-ACP--UDP-N-acetylglucosamine O-acyltransferase [Pseudomonadota bacterium]